MRKLNTDFIGTCQLQQLQTGVYFKRFRNGQPTNEVYYIEYYDPSERKYMVCKYSDISFGILLKGTTLVTTDFEF